MNARTEPVQNGRSEMANNVENLGPLGDRELESDFVDTGDDGGVVAALTCARTRA